MNQGNDLRITVDGIQHPVANLPDDIKQIFTLYQEWTNELTEVRKEAYKLESAIRAVSAEIEARIRKNVDDQRAMFERIEQERAAQAVSE